MRLRHETSHLARIEQAHRVHFVLEAQLVGIDALISAAILQRQVHLTGIAGLS